MIQRKLKICESCSQLRYIWSRGRCIACSAHSTPIRKKPISKREQLYRVAKEELSAGKKVCVFCGIEIQGEYDWHHLDGRDGDKIHDKELLAPAHRGCHIIWHSYPLSKFLQMPLFAGFVNRIATQYQKYYDKLMLKIDKI